MEKIKFSTVSFVAFALCVIAALFLVYKREKDRKVFVYRQYPIMGTFAEIKLYGRKKEAEKAADAIYDTLKNVEKVCNLFDPNSELSKLNKTAYKEPFKCSPLLWEVIAASHRFYIISEGAFDITAKPLMDLWGFHKHKTPPTLPSPEEVNKIKNQIGFNKVILNKEYHTVRFTNPFLQFDLGGIAKGFAVDKAVDTALTNGITSGIINVGGNIATLPVPFPGKNSYKIGIRDPELRSGMSSGNHRDSCVSKKICGYIHISGTAVATSGSYEQYVLINGKKYSHIMDLSTGSPVANDILSVTVVTPVACNADALSTSIFIKGNNLAKKISSIIPDTSILIIKKDSNNDKKYQFEVYGKNQSSVFTLAGHAKIIP